VEESEHSKTAIMADSG